MSTRLVDRIAPVIGTERTPLLAPWGITVLLLGALLAFGFAPTLMPDSYSWVEHGISESAAQGVEGAWLARFGFIFYGLAVVWLVGHRSRTWGPVATVLFAVFGGSMFAVAASRPSRGRRMRSSWSARTCCTRCSPASWALRSWSVF